MADVLLAWVPRNRETLPGLTTNFELGEDVDSGKMVLGAPAGAWKTRYLVNRASQLQVPVAATLEETVDKALELLGDGAERTGGEREVPLFVWRTPHFQQWYDALKAAGNVLEHAKVVWSHRVGPNRKITFFWAIHAEVFITSEGRSKTNEVVFARPDIGSVVLYRRADRLDDTQIVLVREFRTPVSNETGFVWENPGGSSWKPVDDPRELAAEECKEETGLELASDRFRELGSRQVWATGSAHKAHVYAAEITDDELTWLKSQEGIAHGVVEDTERTYVKILTLGEIRRGGFVDWSMIGMILDALV